MDIPDIAICEQVLYPLLLLWAQDMRKQKNLNLKEYLKVISCLHPFCSKNISSERKYYTSYAYAKTAIYEVVTTFLFSIYAIFFQVHNPSLDQKISLSFMGKFRLSNYLKRKKNGLLIKWHRPSIIEQPLLGKERWPSAIKGILMNCQEKIFLVP